MKTSRFANTGFSIYMHHDGMGAGAWVAVLKDINEAHFFLKRIIEVQGAYDIRAKDGKLPAYKGDFEFETGWDVSFRESSDISLEEVLNHEPPKNYNAKCLTPEYQRYWQILWGEGCLPSSQQEGSLLRIEGLTQKPAQNPRPSKAPRVSKEGLITLASFVSDAGDARQALRKASYPKPAGGWIFTEEEATKVKAVLTKAKIKLLN